MFFLLSDLEFSIVMNDKYGIKNPPVYSLDTVLLTKLCSALTLINYSLRCSMICFNIIVDKLSKYRGIFSTVDY